MAWRTGWNLYDLIDRADDSSIDDLAYMGIGYVYFFLGGFTPLSSPRSTPSAREAKPLISLQRNQGIRAVSGRRRR
jgi:hypothetical protein